MEEIEEGEFETNKPEIERRYRERLNYQALLMQRINSVLIAIDQGYDGLNNLNSLLSILIPEIREGIEEDLRKAKEDREEELEELSKLPKPVWNKEIREYNRKLIEINRRYVWKVINAIILALHDLGLLLEEERKLDEGGY